MTFVGLAARNVFRNKFRVVLTAAGVSAAVMTFILLRTVIYAWTVASEIAPTDRIVTRHKVTFVMSLPKRYAQKAREVPGVKSSTYATWFGGRDPKHEREFFATLAADPDTMFDVYAEMSVPADQLAAWKQDRTGAIVGEVLARKLGWAIGDRVTLESTIYPTVPGSPWTFTIRGIYEATAKSVDRSTFVFHWAYLNERAPDWGREEVGWIVSRVDDPAQVVAVSQRIDQAFDADEVQTLSQDERSFNASFMAGLSAVLRAIDVLTGVILLIMTLIVGNTIAMSVRERTSEYGALRAVGFSPYHLAGFVVTEAALIGLAGGVAGVALGYMVVQQGMGRWLEENMGSFFPYFRVEPSTALLSLLLAILLSAAAALIPSWRTSRLNVTEALRFVE